MLEKKDNFKTLPNCPNHSTTPRLHTLIPPPFQFILIPSFEDVPFRAYNLLPVALVLLLGFTWVSDDAAK